MRWYHSNSAIRDAMQKPNDRKYIESRILQGGDVILLATGGHGFEVLEEIEMIEVKQGPYTGIDEKERF